MSKTLKDLKVVFMGTPEFSVPILESLIELTDVVLVVSQPDKLVGRHQVLTNTPVKELALK
jgi:methionyl-tRNA formyltransferase